MKLQEKISIVQGLIEERGYVFCEYCSTSDWKIYHPIGEHTKKEIKMEGLTEGRIVHYVLPNGEHRPAIVVKVWQVSDYDLQSDVVGLPHAPENGCSNLQVFMDSDAEAKYNDQMLPISWRTSVTYSEEKEPGTWHWIEKA